jgi:hypothetical protein
MVGKERNKAAHHEAGHVVIARVLGIDILSATAVTSDPTTRTVPALGRASREGRPVQSRDFEADAISALAGLAAQRRSHPDPVLDVIPNDYPDRVDARAAVLRMIYLRAGRSLPEGRANVVLDDATRQEFHTEFDRIEQVTTALVVEHWRAIERVAKALERHDRIDQAEVDRLIAVAERHETS